MLGLELGHLVSRGFQGFELSHLMPQIRFVLAFCVETRLGIGKLCLQLVDSGGHNPKLLDLGGNPGIRVKNLPLHCALKKAMMLVLSVNICQKSANVL